MLSVERQKDLITSHFHMQLDPFALKLISIVCVLGYGCGKIINDQQNSATKLVSKRDVLFLRIQMFVCVWVCVEEKRGGVREKVCVCERKNRGGERESVCVR